MSNDDARTSLRLYNAGPSEWRRGSENFPIEDEEFAVQTFEPPGTNDILTEARRATDRDPLARRWGMWASPVSW